MVSRGATCLGSSGKTAGGMGLALLLAKAARIASQEEGAAAIASELASSTYNVDLLAKTYDMWKAAGGVVNELSPAEKADFLGPDRFDLRGQRAHHRLVGHLLQLGVHRVHMAARVKEFAH